MIATLVRWFKEGSSFWNPNPTFIQIMKGNLALLIFAYPIAAVVVAIYILLGGTLN